MPTLGTLAAGIRSVSVTRLSEVYITELGDNDRPLTAQSSNRDSSRNTAQYRRFQYFPESVSDTKQTNYQPKEVPGGSLPLYQWVGSGERQITFTAYFTSDVDHLTDEQVRDTDDSAAGSSDQQPAPGATIRTSSVQAAVDGMNTRLRAAGALNRNPYIPAAIAWLRRFMLPRYGDNSEIGVPITHPPHKLLLHFTGSRIEVGGGSGGFSTPGGGIVCVMMQCDITYEAFFPSGNPRIASVNLGFAEVAQLGGAVRFPSATGLDEDVEYYALEARAREGASGGNSR